MLKDDPVLGPLFNTPEKMAKWHRRITFAYIIWIAFLIIGVLVFLVLHIEKML
jgi:hypothetical protein